jgi:hypothetical protein
VQFGLLITRFDYQDEIVTLRRRLQQSEEETLAFKERFSSSSAHAAAALSDTSASNSSAALKSATDALHRDIASLQSRLVSADRAAAFANMEFVVQVPRLRAANAVATAIPAAQRRLLQACAMLHCDLDIQVFVFRCIVLLFICTVFIFHFHVC